MPHHPENGVNAPVGHDIDDLVHEVCAEIPPRQIHVDAIFAFFERIRGCGVVVTLRGRAGDRVVFVSVPRADQASVFYLSFTQRSALMRAMIVERPVPFVGPGHADGTVGDDYSRNLPDLQIDIEPVPLPHCFAAHDAPSRRNLMSLRHGDLCGSGWFYLKPRRPPRLFVLPRPRANHPIRNPKITATMIHAMIWAATNIILRYSPSALNSIRRLRALPSAVSLEAMGWSSP